MAALFQGRGTRFSRVELENATMVHKKHVNLAIFLVLGHLVLDRPLPAWSGASRGLVMPLGDHCSRPDAFWPFFPNLDTKQHFWVQNSSFGYNSSQELHFYPFAPEVSTAGGNAWDGLQWSSQHWGCGFLGPFPLLHFFSVNAIIVAFWARFPLKTTLDTRAFLLTPTSWMHSCG